MKHFVFPFLLSLFKHVEKRKERRTVLFQVMYTKVGVENFVIIFSEQLYQVKASQEVLGEAQTEELQHK